MSKHPSPYGSLGTLLRELRAKALKTPSEVSSAVEIDEEFLVRIEAGEDRPSEDVLLLLIQHFELNDEKAKELWTSAGYSGAPDIEQFADFADPTPLQPQMIQVALSPNDARIVYTDMVQASVNNFGVVLSFLQTGGQGNQPLGVSRIGMSKEHARSVIDILQKTLDQADQPRQQQQLPSPKDTGSE